MDRLIRLLRIINVVQASPGIMARELAKHCETSERNIYRDLELISSANIPITNEGHGKGYKFIGKFKQYPLNWDEDELNAFTVLPALLAEEYHTKSFVLAYEKVMATHIAEHVERKSLLSDLAKIFQSGHGSPSLHENSILPSIIDGVLTNRTIEAVYHTQSRDTTTNRKIDPYFLIPRKNRLYIIGYCHKSNEIRTFRLSRFQSVDVLSKQFTRDDINLEKYLQYTWSIIRGDERIDFKVKFSKEVARYIKEEEYNVIPRITSHQDGSILFEVTVNDDREFLKWVMQYGPEAEIIEPQKYRIRIKETLQKWNEMYK